MSRLDTFTTRSVLNADGVLCIAMGAGLIVLRSGLAGPTGLDAAFLGGAGALLLPVGAFILLVAAGRFPSRVGLPLIVAGNVAWAAASVILPIAGVIAPTPLGFAFLLVQAAAVAVIAAVEARGLRSRSALA